MWLGERYHVCAYELFIYKGTTTLYVPIALKVYVNINSTKQLNSLVNFMVLLVYNKNNITIFLNLESGPK